MANKTINISRGYYEREPWLLSLENRRKVDPKETPSWLIAHLLVVFTRQLEILVTTLQAFVEGVLVTIDLLHLMFSLSHKKHKAV